MTTRTTKLYGKDLSVYDDMDIEELLQQLTPEQMEQLSREVDPDVSMMIFFYVPPLVYATDNWYLVWFSVLPFRIICYLQVSAAKTKPQKIPPAL